MNLYLDQSWTPGQGTTISLTDSSTGHPSHQYQAATIEQADLALQTAKNAAPSWAATTLEHRTTILRRYAELLKENREKLGEAITADTGKPLWEALTEAGAMFGKIEISITAQNQRCAPFGTAPSSTHFRPHGLALILGPFNFPGHLPNGHLVPALLAGNTALLKPSELTPRTANLIVELLLEAGIPPQVIQLIHGGPEIAQHLTSHNLPDAIFFTGSSDTGKKITAANLDRPGRLIALEMGGNNPLIIDEIDDLPAVALTIIQSAFITTGQRCTCARRLILIDHPNTPALLETLLQMTRDLHIAPPHTTPPPFIGPLITPQSAQNTLKAQENLISLGAIPLLEAKLLKPNTGLISPSILDTTPLTSPPDTETFGPLLQIRHVSTLDQAITEANNTRFGLAAGILTNKPENYQHARQHLRAGLINWNQQLTGASSAAPFGGIGDSGNHRPSAYLAADYCNHPVASLEAETIQLPATLPHGIKLP